MAGLRTLRTAKKHAIPVVLERPNTHTGFACTVVEEECKRIAFKMPAGYESTFDAKNLALEVKEYEEGDFILCPSDFVAKTFTERGIPEEKLLRHQYGYDASAIWPGEQAATQEKPLVMIYVGLCTPRKGLHHTLAAWLASSASQHGRFMICGDFVPGYREHLAALLEHSSIQVLGHRSDIPELMRQADVFVLSSIEEGSALVTYEARGSGCVLLVSDAAGAVCCHGENALVHASGNAATLTEHLNLLDRDRDFLHRLRTASIRELETLTWQAAGEKLLSVYREALASQGLSLKK
jgi:glycosyltransferase involved in cell wall biosynthesis